MGKFDKYKIDLKGLQENSAEYNFLLDNQYFAYIDGQEVQKGKVNVQLTVKKISQTFELLFRTEGVVYVACDRCLDDMELPISSVDKLLVKFGREFAEEGDNVVVIPEDEGIINIAWFMYEFIALSIPMKHVHPAGKCNKTMLGKLSKHLRSRAEELDDELLVEDEEVDADMKGGDQDIAPRWSELKKILDNN